jgi:hypothetical protein
MLRDPLGPSLDGPHVDLQPLNGIHAPKSYPDEPKPEIPIEFEQPDHHGEIPASDSPDALHQPLQPNATESNDQPEIMDEPPPDVTAPDSGEVTEIDVELDPPEVPPRIFPKCATMTVCHG